MKEKQFERGKNEISIKERKKRKKEIVKKMCEMNKYKAKKERKKERKKDMQNKGKCPQIKMPSNQNASKSKYLKVNFSSRLSSDLTLMRVLCHFFLTINQQ